MAIPTPKTIASRLSVPMDTARSIRRIMEAHNASGAPFVEKAMEQIAAILPDADGAEIIFPGSGARSPSIDYANRGDTYAPTVLYLDGVSESGRPTGRGRWSVGSWGDIVERGNYA